MAISISELEKFGISEIIIKKLIARGYDKLTLVQETAVNKGLFEGKNMLVAAPTNTGKTFIGELAALATAKRVGKHRTFYLVPLRAIAEEKFLEFNSKYKEYGLRIAVSTSDRTEFDDDLLDYELVVSTYEKLMSLLVRNPSLASQIGVVVVDELQNLGAEGRGVTLEVLLTQLIHFVGKERPQIITLSATVPNYEEVAKWLDAIPIVTEKREIELQEGIQYVGDNPFNFKGFTIEKGSILYREHNSRKVSLTKGNLLDLSSSYAELGKTDPMLVFVQRKQDTSSKAEDLAKQANLTSNATKWLNELEERVEATPSTKSLKRCIAKGVAFHHGGLIHEERAIISSAFDNNDIKVVFATKALAEGVNTPAKMVVIFPHRYLTVSEYKNMAGRAGRFRTGDLIGRSVLIATRPVEFEAFWTSYIEQPLPRVLSQVPKADIDLQILSLISVGICDNTDSILDFFKKSFFGHIYYLPSSDEKKREFNSHIQERVDKLISYGLVQSQAGKLCATDLGKRSAQEMLSPDTAKLIYDAFQKKKTVIDTDYEKLAEGIIHLACCTDNAEKANILVGVPPLQQEQRELLSYEAMNQNILLHIEDDTAKRLSTIKTTQMLMRWIEGADYHELQKYAEQGQIRRIAETVGWLVGAIARIIDKPIFDFDRKVIQFIETLAGRLMYGVREEGVAIAELGIPGIGRHKSMSLAKAGYKTLNSLAEVDINKLREIGIGNANAQEIKRRCEQYILDKNKRALFSQKRRAQMINKDVSMLERLYSARDTNFTRACVDVFNEMGVSCSYMEDTQAHDIDGLIEIEGIRIAFECKRNDDSNLVKATQAEEILGKSASYEPAEKVTIGYPDFAQDAINNCKSAKLTLITCRKLGELLVLCWEGKMDRRSILSLLTSRTCDGKA